MRRVGSTNVIPIDVRVISATNVNIQQQIQQGKFRSDLLYRLNTLEIHIPPLRERPEDILPLIEHQMRIIAAEQGTTPPELTPEAQELLKQYRWPGNVRELRNICERIVVMSSSIHLDGPPHFPGTAAGACRTAGVSVRVPSGDAAAGHSKKGSGQGAGRQPYYPLAYVQTAGAAERTADLIPHSRPHDEAGNFLAHSAISFVVRISDFFLCETL